MAQRVHGTLVASTVTTVTLDASVESVEVLNRSGSSEIYFSTNGTTPTVEGDFFVVPAIAGASLSVRTQGEVIKLISAATPTFSVASNPIT